MTFQTDVDPVPWVILLVWLTFCWCSWRLEVLFPQSSRCLVGCPVILTTKKRNTFAYPAISCNSVLLFRLLPCFLTSWLNIKLDPRKAKRFCSLFPHHRLHLLLFCISHFAFIKERNMLYSARNVKWLEWRKCWHTYILMSEKLRKKHLNHLLQADDGLRVTGAQLPGEVTRAFLHQVKFFT